jgi:flavodoxin I
MSNVAIVYWSGTGNTEAMADLVAEGVTAAGGTPTIIQCADFGVERVPEFDAFAFGCPAMGDEELEDTEFEPMYEECEPLLADEKVGFFGSYDWNNGEWMEYWVQRAEENGVSPVETAIAKDYPEGDEADACKHLGEILAK